MRRVLVVLVALLVVSAGAGVAVASTDPVLAAHGPAKVRGTEATAVFRVGGRTVRQVRYADGEKLVYSFALANDGRLPVTVTGLGALRPAPRLFRYVGLTDAAGRDEFTIPAGERTAVELSLLMHGCETLSARAGSFATRVSVRVERAGMIRDEVTLGFPEEIHTGSPREAFCPNATATSRPPG
ncbi:MAG TPA: hypothetical protein VLB29_07565 [Nocardioidaceae bacterium]|nr:hypothetical protein [Nocardioidaceae bacterium]